MAINFPVKFIYKSDTPGFPLVFYIFVKKIRIIIRPVMRDIN